MQMWISSQPESYCVEISSTLKHSLERGGKLLRLRNLQLSGSSESYKIPKPHPQSYTSKSNTCWREKTAWTACELGRSSRDAGNFRDAGSSSDVGNFGDAENLIHMCKTLGREKGENPRLSHLSTKDYCIKRLWMSASRGVCSFWTHWLVPNSKEDLMPQGLLQTAMWRFATTMWISFHPRMSLSWQRRCW